MGKYFVGFSAFRTSVVCQIMALVLLASFLASPAWATTRYVSTTGSDSNSCAASATITTPKPTFASALPCMAAGDTLYIRAGTYNQIFNFGSTIHGSAGSPITIAGYPGETVIITGSSGNSMWLQYTTDSVASAVNYITFKHLIVDGSAVLTEGNITGDIVVSLNAVHDWIFDDVEVRNCRCVLMLVNHLSYNIWVKNSHFHHNSTTNNLSDPNPTFRYYGIYTHDTGSSGSYGLLVEDSEFDHTVGPNIQISPGPNSNVIYRRNKLHDGQSSGFISGNHAGAFILANPRDARTSRSTITRSTTRPRSLRPSTIKPALKRPIPEPRIATAYGITRSPACERRQMGRVEGTGSGLTPR